MKRHRDATYYRADEPISSMIVRMQPEDAPAWFETLRDIIQLPTYRGVR